MVAFEVFVNGQRLCLAGVGADGVLNAIVNWVGGPNESDIFMHVGGLDSATDEHLRWAVPTIAVGTEIRIRVVEAARVDPPSRHPREPGGDSDDEDDEDGPGGLPAGDR